VTASEPAPPPRLGFTELVRRCTELALGGLGLLTAASVGAVQRFAPPAPGQREVAVTGPMAEVVETLPGALLGLGYAAQRTLLGVVGGVEITTVRVASVFGRISVVRMALTDAEQVLRRLQEQGHEAQARNEAIAAGFARGLTPVATERVISELDVAQIVRALPLDDIIAEIDLDAVIAHLDLDAMLERLDLDAVLERVDANKLLEKIDLDDLMQRIDLERLMARIDVNTIVQRVDLDAVMEKIDLNALMDEVDIGKLVDRVDVNVVVQRVDLAPIAQEVLEVVDIGGIIRESTGSVTNDLVDGARVSAMRVDGFVARLADRLILRRKERVLELPDAPAEENRAG
jgi:hypothetical protein